MNSKEKFEQIYEDILKSNKESMESSRFAAKKENRRNIIIMIILGIIFVPAAYMFFALMGESYEDSRYIILFLFMLLVIYICNKFKIDTDYSKKLQYSEDFKRKIIKALLDSFGEKIDYLPYDRMSSTSYKEAEFEKFDLYHSEDLMTGRLKNNCSFSMGEVSTKREIKDLSESSNYRTLFNGIFSKIKTPKPFKASLYLRKDVKEKNMLNRAFTKKQPFEKLRVELDSQEFENLFDVYCSDKIIAMQLLTADIMQLLIDFHEEMNMEYEITIKNNYIYIRFFSGKMFEAANIQKFSLDKDTLYRYYRMLDFTFSLTDKLVKLINDTEYNS